MFRAPIRVSVVALSLASLTACSRSEPAAVPASVTLDAPDPPEVAEQARAAKEAAFRTPFDAGAKALAAGDPDSAIAHFRQALTVKPDAEANFQMGRAYLAKKNGAEGVKAFTEAIRLNAQHADAYMERAALHERAGKLNDAAYDYRQVIAIESAPRATTARAFWLRSGVMERQGKRADFRYDRRRAMELDPEYRKLVTGGDVCVFNNNDKPVTITFEKFVNADGSERTFPPGTHFTIPDSREPAYLEYGDKPLVAKFVRYTIATDIASHTLEQAYEKGVTLEIHVREEHFHPKK